MREIQKDSQAPTFEDLLTSALTQRCCPICLILEEKTSDLLCQLQFDATHKQEVKELVTSAGGYCHFHFWYLHKLASPVTNAQLLEGLLEKIQNEFPDYRDAPQKISAHFAAEIRCPACRFTREWEEELLTIFTAKIEEEEDFRNAYQQSRGLCLSHLDRLVERLPDTEVGSFLVTATCHQIDNLLQELRLQVSKWHNKDRSPGEEQSSTYRAIEKLVGGRNYWIGLGSDK